MRLARGRILWSCSAHSSADRAARPAECALCIPRLGGLPGIPKLLRLCGLPFSFLLCRCRSPSSAAMLRSLLLAAAALPTVLSLAFDLDPSGVKCIGDDVSKDVLIKGDFRVEVSCACAVALGPQLVKPLPPPEACPASNSVAPPSTPLLGFFCVIRERTSRLILM